MSTIWTPSGERPIRSEAEPPAAAASAPSDPEDWSEEEMRAHLEQVQRQLLGTPAHVVVANHAIGLFQLAVLHLEQAPPNLSEAKLAIDAMAGIVEGLGSRLEDEALPLNEALTQLRLGYVQRQGPSGPQSGEQGPGGAESGGQPAAGG